MRSTWLASRPRSVSRFGSDSWRSDMNARRSTVGWLFAALLLSVLSAPASAQGSSDSRWLAWLGCWEASPGAADEPMLCIVPMTGDVGVEMVAVANGQVVSREWVRAD